MLIIEPWKIVILLHTIINNIKIGLSNPSLLKLVSHPEGAMNIAHYMTGTFLYIKLGYLQNFMQNECSMKCL